MLGSIGMPELIIIFVIALIIFGPRKLPELGRSLGKSIGEFKKASNELQRTLEEEIDVEKTKERRAAVKAEQDSAIAAGQGLSAAVPPVPSTPEPVAAAPQVFTQVWLFISPGLYSHEKKWAIPFVMMTTFFFILGAAFSHFIVFPIVWKFFMSQATDFLTFTPRIEPAFSMYLRLVLAT